MTTSDAETARINLEMQSTNTADSNTTDIADLPSHTHTSNSSTRGSPPDSPSHASPYGVLTSQGASTNIAWHKSSIDRPARASQQGHRSAILWFTGLSGSGKSSLANAVSVALFQRKVSCYVLDGDNVRHGLCKDLGFSDSEREENIRRVGEVAKLFLDAGMVVLTTFISPFRADRDKARSLVDPGDFIEIQCAADLAVCESRDPKGLYVKARKGEIKNFTGVSSPYEAPDAPELCVDTGSHSLDHCVEQILSYLITQGVIN